MPKTIWTIGHSTLDGAVFLAMLESHGIQRLVDVRTFPGSKLYPQFDREKLKPELDRVDIQYIWMPALGGRRLPILNSINTAWEKNDAFRGYADHMQTETFTSALGTLIDLAAVQPTAYMCSEADWQKCHRGLMSDALKAKGWEVLHIVANGTTPHPYTHKARVEDGQLSYSQESLF